MVRKEKRGVKMKKIKRTMGILLCVILMLGGCSGQESADVSDAPEASSDGEKDSSKQGAGDENLVFEYFATSMTVEWIQQIEAALKELGEEKGFELLSADANRDINTQLSQIDTAIEQKIDGAFLFIVDEGSAPAAVEKFDEAGIPVIGETLKLQDGDGKNIAPYVELDAMGVGENCGQWVAENYESCGVDLSDLSKVGIIQNTNSKYRSDLARIDGFMEGLNAGLPGIPESNIYVADCAAEATSSDNT